MKSLACPKIEFRVCPEHPLSTVSEFSQNDGLSQTRVLWNVTHRISSGNIFYHSVTLFKL